MEWHVMNRMNGFMELNGIEWNRLIRSSNGLSEWNNGID